MKTQKTIFITISRGGLIRNLLRTGMVQRLVEAGLRVVILTPYYTTLELFKDFQHNNLYIELLHLEQKEKFRGLFKELCKGVVFNSTVYARYRYSIGTPKQPNQWFLPIRLVFFAPLRYIPGARALIRKLHSFINPLHAHEYLFEKYKPDVVFNTAAGGDCGVLKSAKRRGIPTIDMPKSWDNLSQALFPTKADFLIVWNDFMREKAITLQGYLPNEVIVTGIPQFDFYVRKTGLLSRDEFCKRYGLDSGEKIILFGSSGANLFDETKHVLLIKKFMEEGKLLKANILVRPHVGYRGDLERFSYLEAGGHIVVDKSGKQNYAAHDPFDTSKDHVYNLVNSLFHADVCVNAASTLSLDAIACGTPVINFNFDIGRISDQNDSMARLFVSDYIKDLMATDGTWLAQTKEEFLDALKGVLEMGKRKNVQKTINRFMYKIDGKSSVRIADTIIRVARGR